MPRREAESDNAKNEIMLNPLDHPICLAYPKRVTPLSAWHEHIPFAMFIVDLLRPGVIVELGTQAGDSYCAFCQAVKALNLDTRCYAVDTWRGDQHAGLYDASVLEDLRAHHDPLYGSFSSLIESTFEDALSHFADGEISLLHIDGCHTYEAVKQDFQSWLPKMSEDGVVLFHDTNVRERGFGVSIFWDEIKQNYPHFEFLHGHGLGVLSLGKARSDALQALLASNAEDSIAIRDLFFQLGHRITLGFESEKKQLALEEKENARSQLESELKNLQTRLADREREQQEEIEQARRQEARKKQNVWQLFWQRNEGFSEEDSIEQNISASEETATYSVVLPPDAKGPLRLDPANRPCYAEIHAISLSEINIESGERFTLTLWRAADDFEGMIPLSGIVRLSSSETYRMICVDEDPQLLLNGLPERENHNPWVFDFVMNVSDSAQEVLSEELAGLERELANGQSRLTATTESFSSQIKSNEEALRTIGLQIAQMKAEQERLIQNQEAKERELQSLAAQVAEKQKATEALEAQMSDREHFIESMRIEFDVERQRLNERIERKEAALETLEAEAAATIKMLDALGSEFTEKEKAIESLLEEIASNESHLEALRLQSTSQSAINDGLAREQERLIHLAEQREQTIESLSAEIAQKQELISAKDEQLRQAARRLDEKQNELRAKEAELQKITRSLGWRMLSRFGRIKYGFILPVKHWLADSFEIMFGREYHPSIEPINELRLSNTARVWESTGNDPQFNVKGEWPNGWAEISIDIAPESPVIGRARLYIDRGAGYSEADSYDLGETGGERKAYALLGREVIALRLDPFESRGFFTVRKFTLKRVSNRAAENDKHAIINSQSGSRLKQFARFSIERAESYRRKNGRAPRLSELPAAVRRTLRAWNNVQQVNVQQVNAQQVHDASSTAPIPPRHAFAVEQPLDPYDAWLEVNEWNSRREMLLNERLAQLSNPPLLSVVMPVYNPPPEFLDKAIASVAGQVYQNWELAIADDASADPAVKEALEKWAERDPRIRIAFREENGNISHATNTAADLARGDYFVFMDQDDLITPDALGEVALYLSEHPETDILYSDDDKINTAGNRFAPQFKPDWSPDLLLSYMYFSHLFAIKRSIFFDAGGLRAGYEGSQDYDLALRATELAAQVRHIPKVLYHWRVLPGSTAESGSAKPESFDAGRMAVQDALDRRGLRAKAIQPDWAIKASCGIFSHIWPDDGPSVAVIIPTRNNLPVLRACIESLKKTTYKNYEIVIVDNQSDDPETVDYLRKTRHRVLTIASPGGKFSFAAINNEAARSVSADYVLLLNNDTEAVTPNWLSQMVGYLSMEGVGAVGARLLFPDGRIQHAGIIHGLYNGMAGPAFKLLPGWNHGYLSYTMVTRNYSAVTAACLLTPRELFLSLGGFDEQNFSVAYNDVDYCYRLRAAGYRIVYCPTAELIHHEGYSRGFRDNPAEPAFFRKKYSGASDPFYNPNLSLATERFAIDAVCVAPEKLKPIRALMCAFNLNWEGAPQSQFEMTARLKQQGVLDPIVYCPHEGPLREAYEKRGIPVEVFEHPLGGVFNLAQYDHAIERFAERIKDLGVEVVYGNTRQTFYAIDAAKRLGLPSIWNPRESEDWKTYFDYLGADIAARALQCFAYPYKVIFVSDATRESCQPLNTHHNFATIPNGLDRERFAAALASRPRDEARAQLGISPDEVAILILGTICERKGQIDLIEAIARMDEQTVSRVKCFLVGDRQSDYSDRLKSAVQQLPESKRARIEIAPETSDTALYYSAADLFVLTSRIESFPRVILEAMMTGLPIITAPVYGVREQVQENINALFYQPGDSAELADKIGRLANEPKLMKKLADASKHVLAALTDFDEMVDSYGKAFREAWLSGRSR